MFIRLPRAALKTLRKHKKVASVLAFRYSDRSGHARTHERGD